MPQLCDPKFHTGYFDGGPRRRGAMQASRCRGKRWVAEWCTALDRISVLRISVLKTVVAAAGLSVLAACAQFDQEVASCPNAAILEAPGELVRFKENTPAGPENMLFRTKMKYVSGFCDFDEKSIEMDLSVAMEAKRGAANTDGKAQFTFFIAIIDIDRKILMREEFPLIAVFEKDDDDVNFAESLSVSIPRREGLAPTDYSVYLGFEMTPEELAYNRRRQNRR